VVGYALGSFSSWILRRWNNPLSYDLYLSHDTIQMSILASASALHSASVAASRVVIVSFWVESPIPTFLLLRSKFFLLVFWWPTSIESMLWTCLCGVSKFIVPSLLLLYLVGLELLLPFLEHFWVLSHQIAVKLASTQCFYSLCYDLLI
jgi:hypothetical protein